MTRAGDRLITAVREALQVARGEIPPASWTILDVPLPPSTNRLYYSNHRLTAEHRAWREQFGWLLKIKHAPVFQGPWLVEIIVPRSMRGDTSNRVKAVEDALVKYGVTPDDRIAEGSFCRRGDISFPGGGCMITVRSVRAMG